MVEFITKISCVGCSPEQAFASEYPTSFGRMESVQPSRNPNFGYRHLQIRYDEDVAHSLNTKRVRGMAHTTNAVSSLNAGIIVDAIENSVRQSMMTVKEFREVNQEENESTFIVQDAEKFRDCEGNSGKRQNVVTDQGRGYFGGDDNGGIIGDVGEKLVMMMMAVGKMSCW